MAQVYSLIAWGGGYGKTVTLTIASPCVVTSTNHGLRNGTGLRFMSNGDTLPTGLIAGVTYYTKSTAANTFNLYSDAALTTIINTSGSQSGTHILRSLLVADPANALSAYGLSDLSRWEITSVPGTYRIYDGLLSWVAAHNPAVNAESDYICEIGQEFTETKTAATGVAPSSGSRSTLVHTKINGINTPAFHAGFIAAGYIFHDAYDYGSTLLTAGYRCTFVGFTTTQGNAQTSHLGAANTGVFRKMICIGYNGTAGIGFFSTASDYIVEGCLFYKLRSGLTTGYDERAKNGLYLNNIVSRCTNGFYAEYAVNSSSYVNNIILGNTTNFAGVTLSTTSLEYASNNGGLSTDPIWTKGTGSNSISMTTADFASFTADSTLDDFRPAAATSPQVSTAQYYYGIDVTDISDNTRPAYPGSLYGTDVAAGSFVAGHSYTVATVGTTDFTAVGASSNTVGVVFKAAGVGSGTGTATLNALSDIGCYEYDLGYGSWPATHTLTLANVVVGSRILIRDQAGTTTHYSAAAESSTVVITITVYSDSRDNWRIRIRKATTATFYQPFETLMTATAGESSLYISQIPDE